MKQRIAIPTEMGKLACQFGLCHNYIIYTIYNDGKIESSPITNSSNECDKLLEWLKSKEVTKIIAHKVEESMLEQFIANKINVFIGAPMQTPDQLISKYLEGSLKSDVNVLNKIN